MGDESLLCRTCVIATRAAYRVTRGDAARRRIRRTLSESGDSEGSNQGRHHQKALDPLAHVFTSFTQALREKLVTYFPNVPNYSFFGALSA